jgi:hypothetical protein
MEPTCRDIEKEIVIDEGYSFGNYGVGYTSKETTGQFFHFNETTQQLEKDLEDIGSLNEIVNVNRLTTTEKGISRPMILIIRKTTRHGKEPEYGWIKRGEIPPEVRTKLDKLPSYVSDILRFGLEER